MLGSGARRENYDVDTPQHTRIFVRMHTFVYVSIIVIVEMEMSRMVKNEPEMSEKKPHHTHDIIDLRQ